MLILVVGTGRCGSTLVTETLARHPEVGFISNIDDKLALLDLPGRGNPRLFRHSAPRAPGMVAFRSRARLIEAARLRVAPSEAWNLLDRQVMPHFSNPCRDLVGADLTPAVERRLQRFVERRLAAQRTPHLMLSLTGWPRTRFLTAAFPDARVVHVVRDGRAVAASWLRMGWWDGYRGPDNWFLGPLPGPYQQEWLDSGRSFTLLAGLGWKMLLDAFAAARAEAPAGQWHDLRYEELVADPRSQVKEMLESLALNWTPEFERGFGRCTFENGRLDAYRRELDPGGLSLLDARLADHLDRWGYTP